MPLSNASFSVSQPLATPNVINITDTSTGSDSMLTSRRVYIRVAEKQANGSYYIVPSGTTTDYIVWPIGDAAISLDILTKSTTAQITVLWMTNTVATYTASAYCLFVVQDYLFAYNIFQDQAATLNPNILQDTVYYESSIRLISNIFNAETAIGYDDLTGSAFALARNQQLIVNSNDYF